MAASKLSHSIIVAVMIYEQLKSYFLFYICSVALSQFGCRESELCPCTGHPEVTWFINDGVRSALLHFRAVCSNGFLRIQEVAEAVTPCSFTRVSLICH